MQAPMLKLVIALLLSFTALVVGAAEYRDQPVQQRHSKEAEAVRQVIHAFNQAISSGQVEMMLANVSPGAVMLDLFKARKYAKASDSNDVRSSDLAQRWQKVVPVVQKTTASYSRKATDMDIHVDKKMAVAWVTVDTRMMPVGANGQETQSRFVELVTLRKVDGSWQIASLVNNRHD